MIYWRESCSIHTQKMIKIIYDIILGTSQTMKVAFNIQNFLEHESKKGILHLQYPFVSKQYNFHKHVFTLGQDQTSLLNPCI